MPVATGVREALQSQDTNALAPGGAVGGVGVGLAPPVRGEGSLPAELDERTRRRHHGDTTGQRERALARAQRLGGQVQCHQGGRARRVDGDRRTLQTEGVGQPPGHHARRVPGTTLAAVTVGRLEEQRTVVLAVGAGEDTGPAPPQRLRVDAGTFERLPRHLQQQPLLRIHRQGLTRGDAEETRVEVPRVSEEAAPDLGRGAPGHRVPPPVLRGRRDRVPPVDQQVPEQFWGGSSAGETAAHADDDDRVVHHRRPFGGDLLHLLLDRSQQLAQQEPCQWFRSGVVEDHRGRQGQARSPGEPVPQLDRRE